MIVLVFVSRPKWKRKLLTVVCNLKYKVIQVVLIT